MAIAAERLAQIGGGYALARDGAIVAELALPVAGLMSEEPIETVAALFAAVEASLRDDLGAEDQDKALMNMNFLALPNIPNYGFTNKGLVASDGRMELVDSLVCCGHAE
jgi:adenine deaminase